MEKVTNYENELSYVSYYVLFISIFYLFVGVAEAVIVSKYSNIHNECSEFWTIILVASILDITIPLFTWIGCSLTNCSNRGVVHYAPPLVLNHFGQVIVGLWSVAISSTVASRLHASGDPYHASGDPCHDHMITGAPEMWSLIMIHYVMFWFNIGMMIIGSIEVCYHTIRFQDKYIRFKKEAKMRRLINFDRCNNAVKKAKVSAQNAAMHEQMAAKSASNASAAEAKITNLIDGMKAQQRVDAYKDCEVCQEHKYDYKKVTIISGSHDNCETTCLKHNDIV